MLGSAISVNCCPGRHEYRARIPAPRPTWRVHSPTPPNQAPIPVAHPTLSANHRSLVPGTCAQWAGQQRVAHKEGGRLRSRWARTVARWCLAPARDEEWSWTSGGAEGALLRGRDHVGGCLGIDSSVDQASSAVQGGTVYRMHVPRIEDHGPVEPHAVIEGCSSIVAVRFMWFPCHLHQ